MLVTLKEYSWRLLLWFLVKHWGFSLGGRGRGTKTITSTFCSQVRPQLLGLAFLSLVLAVFSWPTHIRSRHLPPVAWMRHRWERGRWKAGRKKWSDMWVWDTDSQPGALSKSHSRDIYPEYMCSNLTSDMFSVVMAGVKLSVFTTMPEKP